MTNHPDPLGPARPQPSAGLAIVDRSGARTRSRAPTGQEPAALPKSLWTHAETAAFLRIPAATLHQLNYKGTGPRSYKVGRHRRYDPDDVAVWLAQRASNG